MSRLKTIYLRRESYMLRSFIKDERGQGLVEYVLITILIAVLLIGVLEVLGGTLDSRITWIGGQIDAA